MKISILFCLLVLQISSRGQVLSIQQDTVFTSTVNVSNNLIINGNNHAVTFEGTPQFLFENNAILLLKNCTIANVQKKIQVGGKGELQWLNVGTKGFLRTCNFINNPYF